MQKKSFTAIFLVILTLFGVGAILTTILQKNEPVGSETISEVTTDEDTSKVTGIRNTPLTDNISSLPSLKKSSNGRLVYDSSTNVYYLISDRLNTVVASFYSNSDVPYLINEDYIFFVTDKKIYVWNLSWGNCIATLFEETSWPISEEDSNKIINKLAL